MGAQFTLHSTMNGPTTRDARWLIAVWAFALAVGTFAGLYTGLLGLYWQRLKLGRTGALVVAAPLAAILITQIVIYFDQRDLGWVGLGHLLWTGRVTSQQG
jgi:hypothetical protein